MASDGWWGGRASEAGLEVGLEASEAGKEAGEGDARVASASGPGVVPSDRSPVFHWRGRGLARAVLGLLLPVLGWDTGTGAGGARGWWCLGGGGYGGGTNGGIIGSWGGGGPSWKLYIG